MFKVIQKKIRNFFLQKELSKLNRDRRFVTLSQSKVVAVLFDATSPLDILTIKSFLKYLLNKGIDTHMLGYVQDRKMEPIHLATLHINYFNMQHLNFLGIPNTEIVSTFLSRDYDMLINLSVTNSFPTRYLSFKSNAFYKVGSYEKINQHHYDLMIKLKILSLDFFTTNLIHYLELIDKNNEK